MFNAYRYLYKFLEPVFGTTGMLLVDWFAGFAMISASALIFEKNFDPHVFAKKVFEIAECMMEERRALISSCKNQSDKHSTKKRGS